LLIFDDARDYETIKPFVPEFRSLDGLVLVTSQSAKYINVVHTPPFALPEAAALMAVASGR
jgi:hypothetical protein